MLAERAISHQGVDATVLLGREKRKILGSGWRDLIFNTECYLWCSLLESGPEGQGQSWPGGLSRPQVVFFSWDPGAKDGVASKDRVGLTAGLQPPPLISVQS